MCLAVPGKIISIDEDDPALLSRAGRVSFGGVIKNINLAFVPEAQPGDYVNVHAGFAICRIDATEARRVFEYLEQLGELNALEETSR